MEYCWELSVDAQLFSKVLAVAVAIEGMSNAVIGSKNAPLDFEYEELIKRINEEVVVGWTSKAPDDKTKAARVKAITRLNKTLELRKSLSGRALIMEGLKTVGISCTFEDTKVWQDARNAAAHPKLSKPEAVEKVLSWYYILINMMYLLVLSHMGYKGIRIDYSQPGHPKTTMT